ncbi:MAG: isoprenylcysteine carboxylmethyltransferase family protein [Alphaproteobacteria bacterium]
MTNTISKNWLVKTGDFLFKWRNYMFPVMIGVLFILFPVPDSYFGSPALEEWKDVLAFTIIFSGLAFRMVTIGWAYIKRGGLNKEVYADTLVHSGFFGMCRNPLYVGNMMIYAGVFLLHGNPIVVVTGIAAYTFIYIAIIAAEEHYLRAKFGAAYEKYCAEVPRWIPNFSKYKESVAGMNFSIKRSIFKDYSTIFNTVLAIALIEGLEHFQSAHSTFENMFKISLVMLAVATVMLVTVKHLKKSGYAKV